MTDVRNAVKNGIIKPNRNYGQCFLADEKIAEKIVNAAELTPGDHVIEVGPGVCALTAMLCERAGSVVAVEIDAGLTQTIGEIMAPYKNFKLISGDILRVAPEELLPCGGPGAESAAESCGLIPERADDRGEIFAVPGRESAPGGSPCGGPGAESAAAGICATPEREHASGGSTWPADDIDDLLTRPARRIVFVSNMPYGISTQLLTRLFVEFTFVSRAVIMMQKEVCDKLFARPSTKHYCLLTVLADSFGEREKVAAVAPHFFAPQPGVDSAVVAFCAREAPIVAAADRDAYFRVVRAAFAHRRKTLANCLVHAGLARDRAAAEAAAAQAGVPPAARGESLGALEFAALTRALRDQYI